MSIDYRVMQICQLSIVMAESNFKISNDKTENKKLPKKKKKNIKLLKKKNNEGVAKKTKKYDENKAWLSRIKNNRNLKYDQELEEKTDKENKGKNKNISLLSEIFYKTNNNVKKYKKKSICGLSIGNLPYVILSNGKKVFEGGRLDNQCIIEEIDTDSIVINCNGLKQKIIL
ncbi:SctD/MshK family protein [Desulfosarcina variabilis]|uniref:SctD/MshK family protein n=1 Tax=Desulfosarcina variabilis TaxID=2300 RepID=UPI003AFA216F